MATVATGMPAGICTVASSESSPFSEVEGMGTPITGSEVSRNHARQMRRPTRAGDNDADSTIGSGARVFGGAIRRAVRRSDVYLVNDAEIIQRFSGLAHDLQIRITAHHDRNLWLAHVLFHSPSFM